MHRERVRCIFILEQRIRWGTIVERFSRLHTLLLQSHHRLDIAYDVLDGIVHIQDAKLHCIAKWQVIVNPKIERFNIQCSSNRVRHRLTN